MTTLQLIDTYNYTGDTIAFITCLVLYYMIRQALYFSNDINFSYLKKAVISIFWASFANICFAWTILHHPERELLLYIHRDVYHVLLLYSLYIFIKYINNLVDVNGKYVNILNSITLGVFLVGGTLDVMSPLIKFGFYKENGLWVDNTYFKPFTIVYIYALVLLSILFFAFGGRMIKYVRNCLVVIEVAMVGILLMQNLRGSNTYTTFTYMLPIVAVLILIHSRPYDVETGAMDEKVFESFASHAYKKGFNLSYLVLKLDMHGTQKLPIGLGQVMYNFWHKYFKHTMFFSLQNHIFVLAIPNTKRNGDVHSKLRILVEKEFPIHYETYLIDYKIVVIDETTTIKNAEELRDNLTFLYSKMNKNTVYYLEDEKDREKLQLLTKVKYQLEDIEEKMDLNDPRVIVLAQPVRNVATGKYDTAEALMRLNLDDIGMVFPDVFIPMAEQQGYIHALSKIILNKVCVAIKDLENEGYKFERISVNFSTLELSDLHFAAEVVEIIELNDIPYSRIAIELTESKDESDYKRIFDIVDALKLKGIKTYLDDFGTGYSNFDRILSLGLDVVKFDRSLLLMTDKNETTRFTLEYFAAAFKQLKYKILFEGVETEEQEKICLECGADYLQGYKYSKPIPIENLKEFFEKE